MHSMLEFFTQYYVILYVPSCELIEMQGQERSNSVSVFHIFNMCKTLIKECDHQDCTHFVCIEIFVMS